MKKLKLSLFVVRMFNQSICYWIKIQIENWNWDNDDDDDIQNDDDSIGLIQISLYLFQLDRCIGMCEKWDFNWNKGKNIKVKRNDIGLR